MKGCSPPDHHIYLFPKYLYIISYHSAEEKETKEVIVSPENSLPPIFKAFQPDLLVTKHLTSTFGA